MTAWEGSINCRDGVRPFPGWAGLRQGGILVHNETGAVPPWGMAGGRRPRGHEQSNASTIKAMSARRRSQRDRRPWVLATDRPAWPSRVVRYFSLKDFIRRIVYYRAGRQAGRYLRLRVRLLLTGPGPWAASRDRDIHRGAPSLSSERAHCNICVSTLRHVRYDQARERASND
jgi:hypothetical protein